MEFVVHSESNLLTVQAQMNIVPQFATQILRVKKYVPTRAQVAKIFESMNTTSCAVVGSSASLLGCEHSKRICEHGAVISVNDHPSVLALCNRVDVQYLNAHACYYNSKWYNSQSTLYASPQGMAVRPCFSRAKVRLRGEWNLHRLKRYARSSWLSTGLEDVLTKQGMGTGSPTSGGKAVSFAMGLCDSVATYGIGSLGGAHLDSHDGMSAAHNASSEARWLRALHAQKKIVMRCV